MIAVNKIGEDGRNWVKLGDAMGGWVNKREVRTSEIGCVGFGQIKEDWIMLHLDISSDALCGWVGKVMWVR